MRYIVDDCYFTHAIHNIGQNKSIVEEFLRLICLCPNISENVYLTEGFYSKKSLESQIINAEICFSQDAIYGENRELYREVSLLIDRLNKYDGDDSVNGGNSSENDFCNYSGGRYPLGLLTETDYSQRGWFDDNKFIHIGNRFDLFPIDFYRLFSKKYVTTEQEFWASTTYAFNNLYFDSDRVKLNINSFGIPFLTCKNWVYDTLSYLNDHAAAHYLDSPEQFCIRASANNITVSPESGNTHSSPKLMACRNIKIGNEIVCCEWHAKYRYDIGRIHFHFGRNLDDVINKKTEGKLIIGIFCSHLPI